MSYHKKLTIGLFGFGVVGEGLYRIMQQTPSLKATIKKICIKNADKKRNAPAELFTTDKNEALGVGLYAIGAILVIPMVIAMTLIGGIINAFKAVIWSIAYNNIRGKYDGK